MEPSDSDMLPWSRSQCQRLSRATASSPPGRVSPANLTPSPFVECCESMQRLTGTPWTEETGSPEPKFAAAFFRVSGC